MIVLIQTLMVDCNKIIIFCYIDPQLFVVINGLSLHIISFLFLFFLAGWRDGDLFYSTTCLSWSKYEFVVCLGQ